MTHRIVIRPMAERDLQRARRWYERQRLGLGDDFLECVERALHEIADRPLARAFLYRDVRRTAVDRFPYGIFYRIADDVIYVIGVFHGRRSPRTIRRRE